MEPTSLHARLARAVVAAVPGEASTEPHLSRALRQGVETPGGLVRAALVHEGALARGLGERRATDLACAIEYFHIASLMLDDLPCMDDAALRRGRSCVHRVHGDATAILASLSLISRAYALLGTALAGLPAPVSRACHTLVDECLGASGLAGGQAADLRFREGPRDARSAGRAALGKTGGLFILALLLPAMAAGARPEELLGLRAVAVYWSLAYQAVDDLRDLLGGELDTGKTTGRDRLLERPNIALALGVPAARRRARRLVELADRRLARLAGLCAPCTHLRSVHRAVFLAASDVAAAA